MLCTAAVNLAAACGFAVFAGCTADLPAAQLSMAQRHPPDPRIARLEKFFQVYNCPEPWHARVYLHAADDNGLDYRLLPAISIRETSCGVTATSNNWWGYHPGQGGFSSVTEGIHYVSWVLAEGWYYKGKPLREKLFTYNPRTSYPPEVQEIMRQIE